MIWLYFEIFGDFCSKLVVQHPFAQLKTEITLLIIEISTISKVDCNLVEQVIVESRRINIVSGLRDCFQSNEKLVEARSEILSLLTYSESGSAL